MKIKFCFYFLFILSNIFLFSFEAEDSCPTGMRKKYVDDQSMIPYGSARRQIAAVCFFQFPGSLFFSRKILLEPRFEVHLKASVAPIDIVEKARERKIYGFTIVISGYKNTISGLEARSYKGDLDSIVFNDIGYNNFVNSLVIEFDFEKDNYDPDSNSFSLRFCDTSCHSEDYKAFYSNKLNSQKYDINQINNWDFRLVYNTKKLYLYSGPNEVIFSAKLDLEATLGTNIGFVGFTGFMESNRREINLFGSFICEDNYEISKMPGYFLLNGQAYETAGFEAGTKINYIFSFINNKDQNVPHTYGYNIWEYNFNLNTDCGLTSSTISKQNNYTLLLSMNACTKAGTHSIHISEAKKGNAPLRYYTVYAGPLKQILLIGHDGVIQTVPVKNGNYLNYGNSPKGDFIIKPNLKLVLDFDMIDQYGNKVTVNSPGTLFNLKKVNEGGSTSAVTSSIISYTMQKVDNHYQMTISVNKLGTYQIDKNEYMSGPIRFIIIPGEADPNLSFCTLKDYTFAPTLIQGNTVFYDCYLRDQYGNEIDTQTFTDNSIYDFTCRTQRTSPTSKTYTNSFTNKLSYYSCQYITSDTGSFQINGYLTKKGTTSNTRINSKINQFSVRGNPNSLTIKNVLNLYNNKWINANGAKITYVLQQSGELTALDLAESDGVTLISSYGNYPDGFNVNKIKAELYSPHDLNYKFELKPKIIVIDGAEYIGIFTQDNKSTNELVKKSSFDYLIKITLQKDSGNEEKIITINYIINIGSYTTCFHPFNKVKTYLDQSWELQFLTGRAEMKIAKIELKTNDNYLYNYDIGKEKIKYILKPTNEKIIFRVVPLTIEGTYDVYGQSFSDYQGELIVEVDGHELRRQSISSQPPLACYLEFKNKTLFEHLGDDFKEHYYDYKGPFVDGNLEFLFTIKDKFNNSIVKEDYFSAYADIYSLQFGNDKTKFNIFYNNNELGYQFRDNLPFETRKFTWVFFMRDSSCNNKYYINYDGRRGGAPVSLDKSYYNLLNKQININEFAYVDVYYKDTNDQFFGLQVGRLEEIKENTTVIATNEDQTKSIKLEFDSITSNYALRYKKQFSISGIFKVSAKSEDTTLRCGTSDTLNVIDNIYSLKHSKLKLILDSTIDMDPNIRVKINNTVQEPVYKLYFYSKTGVKTTYNKDSRFTCIMTGDKVSMELDVTKKTDYIQFNHKESLKRNFKALARGDYKLEVSDNSDTVLYPLYLTGDGSNDTTNDPNYLIEKTEVYPTHINGVAGKTYSINLEFRVDGGFRWNYEVETDKFTFSNSYKFNADYFNVKVERGYKNGQAIIYVTQKIATTNKDDNILTIYYDKKKITKLVYLSIKCADLAKLVYVSGPTKGDVIIPPILTFSPTDIYGNLYTDLFTSSTSPEYLNSLTIGKAVNIPLTSNNYLENNKYLKVQYLSTISTNVTVISSYFEVDNYKYRIKSGPIDKHTSYAELQGSGTKEVGNEYNIIIYPKDKYNNDIDDLGEEEKNEFYTYYGIIGGNDKNNVTNCKLIYSSKADIYDSINCQTSITKTGTLQFHVDYIKDEIQCINCEFKVISNYIKYRNTKTYYKNKEVFLNETELNEVQAKVEPIFELTFFDQYLNQIESSIVQKLNIEPTFEETDIKLCIANSGNKKVISLCPSTNGDDNVNKWLYITNGENYSLKLQDKDNKENVITYPIKITGGATDGSSEKTDLTKTYFIPDTIKTQAGSEGQTIMELRTSKNIRKNYWYPNPSEKIKVEFDQDAKFCSYKIEKGDLPGQYAIKVTCTKTNDNNSFSVTVESTKLTQKIKLIISSARAYYLEVEDSSKFIVSSDKYTWKENPTNDDVISFSFKLKDRYHNYITNSVIGNNEITISSETYGLSEKYYSLSFEEQNKDYLFTDKIEDVITKHIWNIICTESDRKYSFIYTKIAGKPDMKKSYWTIDKTNYILYESSTVLITLLDKLGVNIGTIEGQLLKEKDKISVVANNAEKNSLYNYISITSNNNLKYIYEYQSIGKYNVSVSYDGKQLQQKVEITVSYQKIDLKESKLYYDLFDGKENLMLSSERTNINNQKEYLFYKLYLYTSEGDNVTVYDRKIKITCNMTHSESEIEWELDVTKEKSYIILTYKDGFRTTFEKLPLGLYSLNINMDGETIGYPLYLLGEKYVSPNSNYDLSKTYINPTYIDGIAGIQYEINIEFRAKDNLRWNYEININNFEISNSYKLDSKNLIIVKQLGEKNGQMKLLVTQNIATIGSDDNVLSFTYKSEPIPTTVKLHIKCGKLSILEYHSGAEDGTVVNPSIVKFIPKDSFGNLFTDLFDETQYTKQKLEKLTKGISLEGYDVTSNSYVSDGQYLNVQYSCKKVTTIKLTCNDNLNPNAYIYKLWSGPIEPDKSYAVIVKKENVIAGDNSLLIIYPKDIYGNNATNVTKEDLDKFNVDYEINKESKVDISESCQIMELLNTNDYLKKFNCITNITKSGEVVFTVDYNDKPITCRNCEFFINPDKIDFSKTKVFNKNENKEMSKKEINTLPVTILPNFELYFFDRFMNSIINQNEVEQFQVGTQFVVTDVKLCVVNNALTKLSNLCKSENNDENEEKWSYLPNGDKYQLIVTNIKSKENLVYPVQLTGGYNDGSSEPIDPLKTYLNPNEITLVAGKEGAVSLELRTANNERKNYWYTTPENHIKVNFPKNIKNCKYSLSQFEKPGQYSIIFNCTEKKDAFNTTVLVENVKVPTNITITIIPGDPAKSKLFRMNDDEITTPFLGNLSVESKFQMKNRLYDKYDNLITNINFQLSTLQIKIAPINIIQGHTWSAEPVAQKNGDIIITLKSTYANEHLVTGLYFPNKYNIIFTHGEPDADNSLLEVSKKEAWVAEEVKIYITPYDKYNNYIDASEYKDISPYQVKYTNEGNTTKVILEKYIIEKKEELNVISYNGTFYVKGTTKINGFIDTKEIKCITCRINIKSKDIYFLNNYVLRFESSKNDFETLKNGITEQNTKEEPIYRLYPRDKYFNDIDFIPKEKLENYAAYLKSQKENVIYHLKLNNKELTNQEYAEFIINDDKNINGELTYETLVTGFYDLVFTDGDDDLKYNITLAGSGQGGSNEPADIQKTYILEQNLKFIAGNTGYMIIEIRTSNNIRKNLWDGFNFTIESCDESDKTFDFISEHAGLLGVFYITVTTQKANTYPRLNECPLKIYVNKILVENLSPQMEVSPDAVVRTQILEKYYKEGSTSVLLDGTADSNYIFEVASFDKYENFAETIQEVVGIKVTLKGGDEVKKITSETDNNSGYRNYSVPATKAGTYIVSTDKSGPKGLYLNESIFVISPGVIDLSKTIIKEKASPIQAGTSPSISIDAFDKYGNALNYDEYKDNFTATFIDSKNEEHNSEGGLDEIVQKVYYTSTTPVIIVGNVKVEVFYNKTEKLDTSKVIIEVIPGDPDPNNSILSRETSKGVFTQYKNGDSFSVDVKEFLILNITLYDKFNNYITNIPTDVKIVNPIMSGNYMEEIDFNVTQNTGYFELDFNDNFNYIYIYQHLVTGTYDLTYVVKAKSEQASFKYNIIISNGDKEHGNGKYDINNCVLIPKNVSFIAGNYEQFTLELRTKQGLLYNDDINITTDILIQNDKEDNSFYSSITKAGSVYGIYTIKIYSEKMGDYSLSILLADPSTKDKIKKEVGPGLYTVYPDKIPDKKYTNIKRYPKENINSDSNFEIEFTLADKFNNIFIERNDMIVNKYLTLLNNKEPLDFVSLSLNNDTYKMVIYPKYPPKTMKLNVLYSDEENTVYCFLYDINVTIISKIDYYQTQIISSNKEKIKVGEILDMWLYTFDKKGECFGEENYSREFKIVVTGPMDSVYKKNKEYTVKKTNSKSESECNNEYQIVTNENEDKYKYAGNYVIKVYGGNNNIAQYNQVCSPGGYHLSGFLLEYDFDPNKISILDTVSFTVSGTDEYGNKVDEPLINDIEISFTKEDTNTEFEFEKTEIIKGSLKFDVSIHVIGSHQLHMFYQKDEVPTVNNGEKLPIFTILTGPCRAENNTNFDLSTLNETQEGEFGYFSFQCYDIYNNKITHGGEKFTVNGHLIAYGNEYPVNNIEVIDNNDGKYIIKFLGNYEGTYFFNILVGKEIYGEEVKWTLKNKECSGETSILCPNANKCVKKLIDCVTPEDKCKEDETKPFWCKVDGEEKCVASQTDCDCPEGYIKCDIMNYCVKENRGDMCSEFKVFSTKCSKNYGSQYMVYIDGICRLKSYHGPNQRVCPIGQVLCADLSCRDTYDDCVETEYLPLNKVRCIGQSITNNPDICPSTYVCPNEHDYVCPNGDCVSNEIECKALSKCNDPKFPYRCQNDQCAESYDSCIQPVACGPLKSLCSDNHCREEC